MMMQFLVEANQINIRTLQLLPTLFTGPLKPKNNWIYLIHNGGTKHKVYIKMAGGKRFKLFEREWRIFLDDSKYTNVGTFHFVRQEEDCYYVTAYTNDGSECNGYDLAVVGYRQRRCLLTLQHLEQSPDIPSGFFTSFDNHRFRVVVGGVVVATVAHRRIVLLDEDRHVHLFGGQGWDILVHVENLTVGRRFVLTNLLNNVVSLMPFDAAGVEMRHDVVERMYLNCRNPFMRNPIDNDKRMKHMCAWEGHTAEHDNERDCFYAPILAYVTDRRRLNIPHDFVKAHAMWQYHNALLQYEEEEFYVDVDLERHNDMPKSKNHVTINCN